MIINLSKICKEGESFDFSQNDRELTDSLRDLIGSHPFKVHFSLRPFEHHIEMKGEIHTEQDEVCSRCAQEFCAKVDLRIDEILMPRLALGRKDHFSRSPIGVESQGPEVTEYENDQLNVGEFVHEAIAFAEPYIPVCSESCRGLCPTCGVNQNNENCSCAKHHSKASSPFSVLESLKMQDFPQRPN